MGSRVGNSLGNRVENELIHIPSDLCYLIQQAHICSSKYIYNMNSHNIYCGINIIISFYVILYLIHMLPITIFYSLLCVYSVYIFTNISVNCIKQNNMFLYR